MKNMLVAIVVWCFLSVAVAAEEIGAVYFNPSRLGSFEVLKATDRLSTNGNLFLASMKINASQAGTVSVTATGKHVTSGTCASDSGCSYEFNNPADATKSGIEIKEGAVVMADSTVFNVKNGTGITLDTGGRAEFNATTGTSEITTFGSNANMHSELSATGNNGTLSAGTVKVLRNLTIGGVTFNVSKLNCGTLGWVSRTKTRDGSGTVNVLALSGCNPTGRMWQMTNLHPQAYKGTTTGCSGSNFSNRYQSCTSGSNNYKYCSGGIYEQQNWRCM